MRRRDFVKKTVIGAAALSASPFASLAVGQQSAFDVALLNGRVMDPESGFVGIRNVGISGGIIRRITREPLEGRTVIDAAGLVVAPGFIDLHQHGQDLDNYRVKVADGVTTALDLEGGTADIDQWYAQRGGRALINYGISIGHMPTRMLELHDPGTSVPTGDAAHRRATPSERDAIVQRIERGLRGGAPAVGLLLGQTPGASPEEVLEIFRVAKRYHAACHVHIRSDKERDPDGNVAALQEVLAAAAATGVGLHIVHLHSVGGLWTPRLLRMIADARKRGTDVTTETYPYTAWMAEIESIFFDEGWREAYTLDYKDLQWAATGERLTAETFARYRKLGGMVIAHQFPETLVRETIASSLVMIASDGELSEGHGHPRTAGTFARVLGRYVRESRAIPLMAAIHKMSLMPARRLEARIPAMKRKGRVRIGADADLTLFDSERVIDRATYEAPTLPSAGIVHVLINGIPVLRAGTVHDELAPGRPVRADL